MNNIWNLKAGDKVTVTIQRNDENEETGSRKWIEKKRCRVYAVYKYFVVLIDKYGIRECFRWQEANKRIRKETNGRDKKRK